jgi:hypothetical protein
MKLTVYNVSCPHVHIERVQTFHTARRKHVLVGDRIAVSGNHIHPSPTIPYVVMSISARSYFILT